VLVNALRAHLDARVDFRRGTKVLGLEQQPDHVKVHTDQNACIECRLVIMATGDARQMLETLGATYEARMPNQVFVAAFTFDGSLGDPQAPDDSQTYHRPVVGGPVAYATFFRLGDSLRANIFCPGAVSEPWQRDLKQRPLEALARHNRLLAAAARSWQLTSPVMTRKVQVAGLHAPAVPRVVVLGDAAHTIDPSGAGGLTFALLEAEVLLDFYVGRWLGNDDTGPRAIGEFYTDPVRVKALSRFFGRGDYVYALNHDRSARGVARRLVFFLRTGMASRHGNHPGRHRPHPANSGPAWQLPAPRLYEL